MELLRDISLDKPTPSDLSESTTSTQLSSDIPNQHLNPEPAVSNYNDNPNWLGRVVWSVVHRYMLYINLKAKVACARAYKHHGNIITITKNKET